ncbi:MAG: S41 family peptidase [Saprospiraceae bacterium]|nr:S41 family peptidase [Saprospiraceae bacterium]
MNDPSPSKFQIRLPLLLALVLTAGMFIGQQLPHFDSHIRLLSGRSQAGPIAGTLDEILRYIEARYVDSVNVADLKNGAIEHLLEQLDPHSVYITPEELAAVEEDMSGNFEGIGIEFLIVDDTLQVVTPLTGGPSETAGVLAGDKIVSIDDTLIAGVKIDNGRIYNLLRGEKGSTVRLGIRRGYEPNLRYFNIIRDVIPMKSVEVAYMLDAQTGYVKVNRFSARTYQEFMEAVRPMYEEQGMKNLVLDLRGNPGGYLNEASDLLSQFFPADKLLVYTEGRVEGRREYKSSGRARFNIQNIAVLIDEGSASASEIVAGALQDHDRAWIIGRRSFGKGLVQEQYPLGDGGALRLTVARYFTPSGRCIQREYNNGEDYDAENERRLANGELSDAHKIAIKDTTKYYTGLGRIVYGGGGVSPDVFIPLDTSFANDYYFNVRQQIPQFTARWMETADRSTLPGDLPTFLNSYSISDAQIDQLVVYAESHGTPRDERQLSACRNELKLQLKARLGKTLFQDKGMFSVLNDDDPAVEKALQLMRSGQPVAGQ